MDLSNFKKNIGYFTNKLKETSSEITDNLAKKFSESSFVLKNDEELQEFIKKSKDHVSENGKIFKRRVLVIFGDSKTDFYKEMLKYFPILFTKSWASNNSIRLIDKENVNLKKYKVSFLPSLIAFESEEFLKEIPGENNIRKIVFNPKMDIIKLIDEIKLEEPKNEEKKEDKKEKKQTPKEKIKTTTKKVSTKKSTTTKK